MFGNKLSTNTGMCFDTCYNWSWIRCWINQLVSTLDGVEERVKKTCFKPEFEEQDNLDNYNRCLEKSENKKGPKIISYNFSPFTTLILIFCVLFFATWRAMKTLSQVRLRFRYSGHGRRMQPGSKIDDPRNSTGVDSIIVVGQLAIHTWPIANLGNISRYSNCSTAMTRARSLSISRN